jgi:hypothetical protein
VPGTVSGNAGGLTPLHKKCRLQICFYGESGMKLKYTYWHWTQGKTLEELEEMLADLYEIFLEKQKEHGAVEAGLAVGVNNLFAFF